MGHMINGVYVGKPGNPKPNLNKYVVKKLDKNTTAIKDHEQRIDALEGS